jgi:hypothetical protein
MTKLLFDNIHRQIILDFYRSKEKGNRQRSNIIVRNFEILKLKREFQREIEKPIIKILNNLDRIFRKLKLIK